jgi:hypothetical protein
VSVRNASTRLLLSSTLLLLGAAAVWVGAARAATTNPCRIVTAADARAALGAAVSPATATAAGLYQNCTYRTSTGKGLIVLVRKLGRSDFVKSAKANPGKVVAVAGIGSAAFSVQGTSLLFWRKNLEVVLSMFGVSGALKSEERLAKKVAGRI